MFTDFYIATTQDAEALVLGEGENWPRLTLDSVTDFEILELAAILVGEDAYETELVFIDEEQGVAVQAMDPALAASLAALSPDAIVATAMRWAKAEGFDGADLADVREALGRLAGFAAEAQQQGKRLLFTSA
jgi:hypothetical protein